MRKFVFLFCFIISIILTGNYVFAQFPMPMPIPGEKHPKHIPEEIPPMQVRAIQEKYKELGGSSGFLGQPLVMVKTGAKNGYYQEFQGGNIYWHQLTGAHEVRGAILHKYRSFGAEASFLAYPQTDETKTPDSKGRFNHFQGGSIYWTAATRAYEVHGAIWDKWKELGWEKSVLGYPTTDETKTPDGVGRYNHFENGSIYWTADTGAHEVNGPIRDKWEELGWEKSVLGYPTTDETKTPDGVGRYNHFENGSIYWTAATGAREVHGAILDTWKYLGWEKSGLGYPTTDETKTPDGTRLYNNFQGGSIYYRLSDGHVDVDYEVSIAPLVGYKKVPFKGNIHYIAEYS